MLVLPSIDPRDQKTMVEEQALLRELGTREECLVLNFQGQIRLCSLEN